MEETTDGRPGGGPRTVLSETSPCSEMGQSVDRQHGADPEHGPGQRIGGIVPAEADDSHDHQADHDRAQDDDSGGYPNARIVIRAMADGEHRIIATGLADFAGLGDFTLTVRTLKDEK